MSAHLLTTEKAILRHGFAPMASWMFLKRRANNGVIYRGAGADTLDRLGWSRSTFYNRMSMLIEAGLARKDKWGNYRLKRTAAVVGATKHKCTLKIRFTDDERTIADLLRLKLAEVKHRQVIRHHQPQSTRVMAKLERQRLLEEQECPGRAKTAIKAPWGSSKEELVKFAKKGYAAINTDRLSEATQLGRTAVFAWKKRMKRRGALKQVNREWWVQPSWIPIIQHEQAAMQAAYRGVFVPGWSFHQASMYKFNSFQ